MLKFPANTKFINLTSGTVRHGYHINCYSENGQFLGTISKERTLGDLNKLFTKGREIRLKPNREWAQLTEFYTINGKMEAKSGFVVKDPYESTINKLKG